MKIYFASQSFYPHIGGVSTYLLNLEKQLKNRGNEVVELHLRPSNTPSTDVIEDIKVIRVPREPLDWDMLAGYSKFKEAIYKECHDIKGSFKLPAIEMPGYDDFIQINDAFGREVRDMLNREPADVIHIHDFQLIYLYRYVPRGTPLIFTWHIPLSKRISIHLQKFLSKHLNEYDKIVFSSPDYIEAAVKIGIPREKCWLIYPICNTDLFRKMDTNREEVFKKYNIPINSRVILSVQRIDPKSGHEQLIRAMSDIIKSVPDSVMVFAGGASLSNQIASDRKVYEEKVHRLIEEHNLFDRIIFTGNIDYHSLPELYNAADVVALCSKNEGFGLSVTEAMACGKPIVANRVGGLPLQVKDGDNGFLIEPGDSIMTALRITELLKNRRLLARLGKASIEIVEKNFKMELAIDKHIHLYNTVLNEKVEGRRLEKMDIHEIEAFITDYDRTLTDEPGDLRQAIVDELSKLNTTHILVTGRQLGYVKVLAKNFGIWDAIVCENGAIVYMPESGREIVINSMHMEKARRILKRNRIVGQYGKVIVSVSAKEAEKAKKALLKISKNLNYVWNVDEMMILPKYVNKGTGAKLALDYLGIPAEKTIVVGDAENDIDLFAIPAFKVAVANAHPRLKLIADQVTDNPASSGIAEIVGKLLA